MSKEIRISMSYDDIAQAIEKTFKPDHAKLMTQAILEVLSDSDSDLESVFKASMGITPKVDYFVGQQVIADINGLSDWRFDKQKMIEEGLLSAENTVLTIITHVRPFSRTRTYTLQYEYIDKDTGKRKTTTSETYSSYVKGLAEVFPGDDL